MRILHTADIHIGQTLYQNYSRTEEHLFFFSQIEEWIRNYKPEALVISGDVFDIQMPGITTKKFFNDFFVELHRQFPELTIVISAGNHDSSSRLNADRMIWEAHNVHIIATPPPPDLSRAREKWQENFIVRTEGGYIIALPFLPGERTEQIQFLLDYVNEENSCNKPVVMTAHATVAGTDWTGHEFIGNVRTVEANAFGRGFDYLAMGHIHRPQTIGHLNDVEEEVVTYPAPVIRYSGSPLRISCDEEYPHSVSLVDIDSHGGVVTVRQLFTEELLKFHTLPADSSSFTSFDETMEAIKAFAEQTQRGYFRVRIDIGADIPPDFNQNVYDIIESRPYVRYNPKIIWTGRKEQGIDIGETAVFEIADLQQMTDPLKFIERTIDRYPDISLDDIRIMFKEVEREIEGN